jgi:hypothetical protein
MTGFWGFVYMPGGHEFIGQVAILAVTCVVAYCCLRALFTELPRRSEPVEKLSVAYVWPSIQVEKRLFRGSKARFGASRAGLCSHERAWIEFFNRLTSSR